MMFIKYECNTCKRWLREGDMDTELITARGKFHICKECAGDHYFHEDGRLLKKRQGFGKDKDPNWKEGDPIPGQKT